MACSLEAVAALSVLVTVCVRAPACLGLFFVAVRDSVRCYADLGMRSWATSAGAMWRESPLLRGNGSGGDSRQ